MPQTLQMSQILTHVQLADSTSKTSRAPKNTSSVIPSISQKLPMSASPRSISYLISVKISIELLKASSDRLLSCLRWILLFLERLQGHHNRHILRQQLREHSHHLRQWLQYRLHLQEILLYQILLPLHLQEVKDSIHATV